ncbi:MAG: 6-carboxytetrahydropterin synthase [Chloroflexi bacterium]|nr:6-carboxytetrahydropterin synthase [Chloroflexota bacterium]
MFEIGVVAHFEAAHRLRGNFGPATRLHGHTYRVEVGVRGDALRDDGTLCDLGRLQDAAQAATSVLHYRDLDEVPELAGRNTTAEVVARFLADRIAARLEGERLRSLAVRVWESPHAYAAYERDLGPGS